MWHEIILRSSSEHFFVFLEVNLQFFVLSILAIDGSDVPYIPYSSVIVLFKLLLVGLNLFSQLPPFLLYAVYQRFYLLLRHLLASSSRQRLL